jgi:hypothetical protein
MIENTQQRSETLMKRSGTVRNGHERSGTVRNGQERKMENGHGTVTITRKKRKNYCKYSLIKAAFFKTLKPVVTRTKKYILIW